MCSGLPLTSDPAFPIGAFWPPSMQSAFNTLARFQEMKDAGFTFSFIGASDDDDPAYINSSLSFLDQVGLKALVVNGPERAVQVYPNYTSHPSFVGFRLYDEPAPDAFADLATGTAAVRAAVPTLLPYINLPPGGGEDWRRYVQQFVGQVNPSQLSYDRYPLNSDGSDDPGYFAAWQDMRSAGLGTGLATWIYIQSLPFEGHRSPSAAELGWQVNVSLAYGCKGIQYFCYWTPRDSGGETFGPALIDFNGNRTPIYDAAKALNTGWLTPVGAALKPLVSEQVVHANESSLPAGALGFSPDVFLSGTGGSPVILGRFRSADRKSRTRWLLVANRSHSGTAQTTINVNTATVTAISRFDPATSTYVAQSNAARIAVSLAPGAAALFRLDATGASLDPQVQLVLVSGGTIYHAIQQVGGGWNGPNPLGDPARLVAISEINGAMNLIEIADDVVYHRVRAVDGSWSTRNEFGALASIASVATAAVVGSLQVVFVSSGVIFHAMQHPDGSWDGPNRLGDAANLVAATELHGTLNLIEISGAQIYHRVRYGNGEWSSRNLFDTVNGITSVAVTAVAGEMNVVLVAGGQVYYAIQHVDGSWQWPTATGDMADQVAASSVGDELQITEISGGQAYVRTRHGDGSLSPRTPVGGPGQITAAATTGRSPAPCM
ncbi:hypothetical protein [Fodinicola feengrottensis]|uniref:Glycoside hydrolase family 42 N-terminal domain-containing protein n=2 Tax=Fodinicola feengrottensis TaxID=435914 RepID=A0ABP4RTI5_9ACTN|nr:hypothetical protein [Fodinicola feengrottensis]